MNDNSKRIFGDAVSIETQRIFDACSDRDCICDLPVQLDEDCCLADNITIVKTRKAEVCSVCISTDPVPFKSGYYSVDITYNFRVKLEGYEAVCSEDCVPLTGTAVWSKRVILYGSQGNIRTFSSEDAPDADMCCRSADKPRVTVSVVTPIALETKIKCAEVCQSLCPPVPKPVPSQYVRGIYITLGLFAVIQLTRPVSLLIPTYDYCIPGRECGSPTESAKDIFCRLDFPTEQFFPRADDESICGCIKKPSCDDCCEPQSCADDDNGCAKDIG